MLTLGTQEMVFIFILALVLFGPKKLPEIARTVGKALKEFRRASSELKATFDREMNSLESESHELKGIGTSVPQDTYNYNYDYSSYEATYEGSYTPEEHPSDHQLTAGDSAPQDAELTPAHAPEGTVAHGAQLAVEAAPEHTATSIASHEAHSDSESAHAASEHDASEPAPAVGHNT